VRRAGATTPVVYVHGLWMPGEESLVLGHRIENDYPLTLHTFRYSTAFASLERTLARLAAFVAELDAAEVHFLGHSLGGLIIHRLLERHPDPRPGRVVFLGTPCVASRAAEQAGRFGPIAQLMGPSVAAELLTPHERRWRQTRTLGIIAGSQPLGVGQFLAGFEEDNDGTVAVSETRMPGASAHLVLPVSHVGMLLSARVAEETGRFLAEGRFAPDSV